MNEAMKEAIKRMMNTWWGEFNDAKNRNKLQKELTIYLCSFQPEYLVVCDETNNTPKTIDENKLIVDIYEKEKCAMNTHEFILGSDGISVTTARVD